VVDIFAPNLVAGLLLEIAQPSWNLQTRCATVSLKTEADGFWCEANADQGIGNMKSYRKELWFNVPTRRAFINITPDVQKCIDESGVKEGLVLVNAMHITASVFINDDESGLHHDYDVWLEKLAPHAPVEQYRHNVGEDNADAHMKRQIMGREVVVAITEGRLDFGTWERIFYGEFDGRRKKRVLVKIIGV
jgi:secondary thiamine-phosphate synthase enzyme